MPHPPGSSLAPASTHRRSRAPKGFRVSFGRTQKAERAAGERALGLYLLMPPQGQSQAVEGEAGSGTETEPGVRG